MSVPEHIQRVEDALVPTSTLVGNGMTVRDIAAEASAGRLVRVARGWFVPAEIYRSWFPAGKHLAAVIAAHRSAKAPPVFSHHSAAALLGLPMWDLLTERVHTACAAASSSSAKVQRHRSVIPSHHLGAIGGYRCTSPERTLYDLAHVSRAETLIGCADKVLALVARSGRKTDKEAWDRWRHDMGKLISDAPKRARGVDTLRRCVELADPRAESVLESVSRLQLLRIGFELRLQVPVESPAGNTYYMDFEFRGLGIFGECDGDFKYTDRELLGTRSPEEAVVSEKKRDNWVAGRTNHRMVHWGARDVGSPESLGATLRSFHVPLPRWSR